MEESDDSGSDQENMYVIEAIVGMKIQNGQTFWLIKWQGYDELTWEPSENLLGNTDDILNFIINFLNLFNNGL